MIEFYSQRDYLDLGLLTDSNITVYDATCVFDIDIL